MIQADSAARVFGLLEITLESDLLDIMTDLAPLGLPVSGPDPVLLGLRRVALVSECLNPGLLFLVVTFLAGLLRLVQSGVFLVFVMALPCLELLISSSGYLSLHAGGSVTSGESPGFLV